MVTCSNMNRRTFLGNAAALTSALKLPAADARPSFPFPTDPAHRLSVSTYPFRDYFGKGKLTLQAFAATVVEKFGV